MAAAFDVLHAHDVPISPATYRQVHKDELVLEQLGYRDLAAASGPAASVAREVVDALTAGATIAVRHDGKTPGLERAGTWALFLGAHNSLKATLFTRTSHGHVHWRRVRDVDVSALARHGGSFGIVQPFVAGHARQLPAHPDKPERVYAEPLASRSAPVAIDENAAMLKLEAIIQSRYSGEVDGWDVYDLVRDYAASIKDASTAFHTAVIDRLVDAMPSTVGAAMQGGAVPEPAKRLAVAKHLALFETSYLAQDMRSFQICDPQDRADIARLVVHRTGSKWVRHIEDAFDIVDASAGARIDALAAKRDGELAASKTRSEKR